VDARARRLRHGLILAAGAIIDSFGLRLAAIAAPALVPNILGASLSGVLLGTARLRLWNYIQLLPPALTLAGMLVVVVGLGGGVDAAVAMWTASYFVTAAFALVASCSTASRGSRPSASTRSGCRRPRRSG